MLVNQEVTSGPNGNDDAALHARGTTAKERGKTVGRPRKVFRRDQVAELRSQGLSWREIARRLGVGAGTVRRVLQAPSGASAPCQNPSAEEL